jgi:hypothetical protein
MNAIVSYISFCVYLLFSGHECICTFTLIFECHIHQVCNGPEGNFGYQARKRVYDYKFKG